MLDGVLQYKLGAAVLPTRPVADTFLYRALVLVNTYKCAIFQLPSFIRYGYIEGSQTKKWELLISSDAP